MRDVAYFVARFVAYDFGLGVSQHAARSFTTVNESKIYSSSRAYVYHTRTVTRARTRTRALWTRVWSDSWTCYDTERSMEMVKKMTRPPLHF